MLLSRLSIFFFFGWWNRWVPISLHFILAHLYLFINNKVHIGWIDLNSGTWQEIILLLTFDQGKTTDLNVASLRREKAWRAASQREKATQEGKRQENKRESRQPASQRASERSAASERASERRASERDERAIERASEQRSSYRSRSLSRSLSLSLSLYLSSIYLSSIYLSIYLYLIYKITFRINRGFYYPCNFTLDLNLTQLNKWEIWTHFPPATSTMFGAWIKLINYTKQMFNCTYRISGGAAAKASLWKWKWTRPVMTCRRWKWNCLLSVHCSSIWQMAERNEQVRRAREPEVKIMDFRSSQ